MAGAGRDASRKKEMDHSSDKPPRAASERPWRESGTMPRRAEQAGDVRPAPGAEQRLQLVIASAPVIIFAVDCQGVMTLSDGQGLAALGLAPGELVGKSALDLFEAAPILDASGTPLPPDDVLRRVLLGGEVRGLCHHQQRVLEVRIVPLVADDRSGEIVGATGVAVDVTDRARAEHAYQEAAGALGRAEQGFLDLVDASTELVLIHQSERIVYSNGPASQCLGYDPCALSGLSFSDVVHPDDRARLASRHPLPARASERPPLAAAELRFVRKDGTAFQVESTSFPIVFRDALATVVIATDITERNEARAALLRSDRLAALGTLAAGAAHEINNPLTYALINIEHGLRQMRVAAAQTPGPSANEAQLSSRVAPLFQNALEGVQRVRQIVKNLTTFARGDVEVRALVDVRGVLESAIQMALHEIRYRARLVRSLNEVPPVEANEVRLGQVFLNLLVNAAEAIPEGEAQRHEVRVSTRVSDAGEVIVEVADTGAGIAEADLPRVFDPFFTTKPIGRGMGLGLSISHGTVRSLGGTLTAHSAPGKGSIFRVILPAAAGWRISQPGGAPGSEGGERLRVLVIDDDVLVAEAIERSLSGEHEVITTGSARQALERIHAGESFDVILCDVMMPDMSGMDLYAELLRRVPQAVRRVVFMTAGAFTQRAREFLSSVGSPCIDKPIDLGELRALLRRRAREAS